MIRRRIVMVFIGLSEHDHIGEFPGSCEGSC